MGKEIKIKKKNLKIIGILIGGLLLFSLIFLNWEKIKPDQIVAKVNGEKIYLSEVELLQTAVKTNGQEINQSVATEQLVARELLVQESAQREIIVSDEEVEQIINNQLTQSGQSMKEFKQMLGERGTNYEKFFEAYRTQLILQKLMTEVSEERNLSVSDKEIDDFYKENKQLFGQLEGTTTVEQIKDQIRYILEQQKQSEVIYELVEDLKQHSEIEYLI